MGKRIDIKRDGWKRREDLSPSSFSISISLVFEKKKSYIKHIYLPINFFLQF
jgi:hypothetical protein